MMLPCPLSMRHAKLRRCRNERAADAAGSVSGSRQPGEAIGAPFFAADAVVDDEKTRGVVFLLDREQLRIVGGPVGALPFALEEAAFRDITALVRRHFSQFVGGLAG